MKNFLGAQPWEGARESKVIKPWLSRGKWVVGDNRKSISLCAAGGGVVVLRGRGVIYEDQNVSNNCRS